MKKLLIVDVPESVCLLPIDFMSIEVDGIDFQVTNKQLTLPSEDEIEQSITECLLDQLPEIKFKLIRELLIQVQIDGANWYRNEILKQLK
jgi:hypothetical protein